MNNSILQKISKDDFQLLLTSLEDVFYKSTSTYLKDEIINIVKEYIIIYHKGSIDSFIADLMVGDNEFISISFISSIRYSIDF